MKTKTADLSDAELAGISGGFAWFPLVLAPILVGAAIGVSNQVSQALIDNWDDLKAGFGETAL